MKKYLAVVLTLCLVLGMGSVSVFAATVGGHSSQPDAGWKRFEDNNTKFNYEGIWDTNVYPDYSGRNAHLTEENGGQFVFKFKGTKFRIISQTTNVCSNNIKVMVDGITEAPLSEYNGAITGSAGCATLVYEKTGLKDAEHIVTLTNQTSDWFQIDAVDIDDVGYLVDITKASLYVLLNESETIQLSTSYNLANNANFAWASADETIATVDANGKVTAVALGETEISVQNADATFKESIPVKVLEKADEQRLAIHLRPEEKAKLYLAEDASTVTWTSFDESVVTVGVDGELTVVAKGLAIVKAELEGETYQVYVRVNS